MKVENVLSLQISLPHIEDSCAKWSTTLTRTSDFNDYVRTHAVIVENPYRVPSLEPRPSNASPISLRDSALRKFPRPNGLLQSVQH